MSIASVSSKHYRPDVDGLRAIAVLSVILFHVNPALVPGGFVGVDIFFVISGFLISRNILEDLNRGRFSIVDFYRRRVKRIAPAMLVVVGVTLITAQALMLPEDAEPTAESALWSLLSLGNVYFWLHHDASYFAAASHDQPLLHLWSLGVEEQFYALWPLLLLLVYRLPRSVFAAAVAVLALASFLYGEWSYPIRPSFAYYMLPTRAGELFLGAIVAMAVLHHVERRISTAAIAPIAIAGLGLMCTPLFLLSEASGFPGLMAIPPTLGTALIILAGHCGANPISRALALTPLVWVGLVSYSAYLWHWPLLAFYRYGRPEVGALAGVMLIGLTFLFAWLTYRYVERPARRSSAGAALIFTRQFAVPAGALCVIALAAMKLDGYILRSESYKAQLAEFRNATRPAYLYDYVCQRQRITATDVQDPRCVVGADVTDPPIAILWGDSNAAHYVGVVGAIAKSRGFRFRNLEVGACPPLLSDPAAFVSATRLPDCRAAIDVAHESLRAFDIVMISAAWTAYQGQSEEFLGAFFDTAISLVSAGKTIVLIGEVPTVHGYDRRCREKAIIYPGLICPFVRVAPDEGVQHMNATLRAFAYQTDNVEYVDVTSYLCQQDVCSAFDANGNPRYFDPSHLTLKASWMLGEQIVQEGVPAPFEIIVERAASAHATVRETARRP